MIKKAQICFMFFAVMMIMVHSIIPHHHHRTTICICSSNCLCEYHHHDHKNPEHHSTDTEIEHMEDCDLQHVPTIPQINVTQLIIKYGSFNNFLRDIKLAVLNIDYTHILFFNISCFYALEPNYAFLIHSSSGLRAPPLV
jgi:hypothetical protein